MHKLRLPSFRGRSEGAALFAAACLLVAVGLVSCGGAGGGGGTSAPPSSGPPTISVSINSPSPLVQVAQAQPFSATVQNDVQSSGVTWSVSACGGLCGTLTLMTPTSVTYTAPASKPAPATNTLTATSIADGSKSQSVVIAIAAVPAILSTDDFDRPDVNPITAPWLNYGPADGAIVGHRLAGSDTGDNFIFLNSSPPPDQYAKINFISSSGGGADNGGPIVRMDANGNGWLFNWISNSPLSSSTWHLFRVQKGVGTPLATGVLSGLLGNTDVVEIRAVGSVIIGYLNGVAVQGATTIDATYPTGGFGVHLFSNTGTWDDFEGGSL